MRGAEVVVVGGGPAGAATAALLSRSGVDVLVLEKARFPREKPCAEYFSPGVEDALDRLGALAAVEALRPYRAPGMRLHAGGAVVRLGYPDGRGGERTALCVDRPRFDAALLGHARVQGARVEEGRRVVGVLRRDGAVTGVRTDEGDVEAGFVVGADGLHSAVARGLGLERRSLWPRRLGLVARFERAERRAPTAEAFEGGAEAGSGDARPLDEPPGAVWSAISGTLQEGETWPPVGTAAQMHVGRGAYCGIAPLGGDVVNVGLVTGLDQRRRGESTEAYFERRLADLPGACAALDGARRVTPIRGIGPLARRVARVAGRGYLLVGDAAGFLDPFTGEGVHRALRGAEIAAPAVAAALGRGDNEPAGYEAARRRELAAKEALTWLVQGFLLSERTFGYALRRLAERPEAAGPLARALGDFGPADPLLRPRYLWSLLGP